MGKRSQLRWRERRETRMGRRRRRQRRRRDIKRGTGHVSCEFDPSIAARGVSARLWGATGAVALTLACLILLGLSSFSTFTATFALTFGLSSFAAAVGLLLSARHEEEVHAVASELDRHDDPAPEQLSPDRPADALPAAEPPNEAATRSVQATDGTP